MPGIFGAPGNMTHGRTGGRQDAFELHGRHHIGEMGILIVIKFRWIEGIKTRCQYHGTDVDGFGGFLLIEIYSTCGAELLAGAAFAFLHPDTVVTVDAVFQGNCLGILDESGFAFNEPYIVVVLDFFRTFFSTQPAGDAKGFIDVSGFLKQLDLKVTCAAFYIANFTEGSQLDV